MSSFSLTRSIASTNLVDPPSLSFSRKWSISASERSRAFPFMLASKRFLSSIIFADKSVCLCLISLMLAVALFEPISIVPLVFRPLWLETEKSIFPLVGSVKAPEMTSLDLSFFFFLIPSLSK